MNNETGSDYEIVTELLRYNPSSGRLFWKVSPGRKCPVGTEAGKKPRADGRKYVRVRGKRYTAHRLIWLLVTGSWPENEIDHVNRNPSDNRWSNLREATRSQNNVNRKLPIDAEGWRGVRQLRGCRNYQANITVNGATKCLGSFPTKEEARAAYLLEAKAAFGAFVPEH